VVSVTSPSSVAKNFSCSWFESSTRLSGWSGSAVTARSSPAHRAKIPAAVASSNTSLLYSTVPPIPCGVPSGP
jgi:hypothetical protein